MNNKKSAFIIKKIITGVFISTTLFSWIYSVNAKVVGNTNTWLDKIVEIINNDEWLQNRFNIKNKKKIVIQEDLDIASKSSNSMNKIIINAIKNTWVANDWIINTADARDLNDYIYKHNQAKWKKLHWDDEKNWEETWYHRVQNDWANTIIYWDNAINTVFDSIYHLWFTTSKKNRLLNEDWNNNATFASVWYWINDLLKNDIKNGSLKGTKYKEIVATTNTWLDIVIDIIKKDPALAEKVSTTDMREASKSANWMNEIIIEAIINTWVANDWIINTADAREINDYIYKKYNHKWLILHWDDEKNWEETWYHRVQNDWAVTQIFGKNALNKVFDSIYHLWFESSKKNRLLNEDWNNNAKFSSVWFWLNYILKDDLRKWTLKNWKIIEIKWTTNTWLDEIVEYLKADIWLNQRVKTSDMINWAKSADGMNKIIVEAIKNTWVFNDWKIWVNDVRELNLYIVKNHKKSWAKLHWDDEDGEEYWFHLVQNDWATKKMFNKNAVNTVFDWIYHLGFSTDNKNRLKNEDWNNNASFSNIALWLDWLMKKDLSNPDLKWNIMDWVNIISWEAYVLNNGSKLVSQKNWILIYNDKKLSNNSEVSFTMNSNSSGRYQNGYLIFDYKSETDFKFIWARVWANYWNIWEFKNGKWKTLKRFKENINTNKNYNLNIIFNNWIVKLNVNWKSKLEYTFKWTFNNKMWFALEKAITNFTNLKIK